MVIRVVKTPPLTRPEPSEEPALGWNDQELLAALRAHEPRAGVALYDRLIRIVEWTILRVVGRRSAEHDDLVQSAFEQIVVTLNQRRYEQRCSLTSWASAISTNVALNALRAQRKQRTFGAERELQSVAAEQRADPDDQLAARQTLERVRAELARMNPHRARALVLHEVNGLELAEIAAVLGISVTAVQSRVARGRSELLKRLSEGEKSR